jgi:hypothetical protein
MPEFQRNEVEAHFKVWREAVDTRDLDAMGSMLAPDARGGNAVFGIFEGREAMIGFTRDHWPESVPNRSEWHAIDGIRVVNKWRETLPGDPPSTHDYHYYGISEFIYAGSNQWNFMYGLPDVVGLTRVQALWRKDSQEQMFGEIYPGLS